MKSEEISFNSLMVRLKVFDAIKQMRDLTSFNSLMVRLKAFYLI